MAFLISTNIKTGVASLVTLVPATLALLLAVPVRAADPPLLDMDLEQLLNVSITGATLREESIKTVPSSTTVFTHVQLENLGLDYLHELLDLVPGLQVHRGADSPINYTYSMRGRRQGARAREILLLVDGRIFSDPRSGGSDSALVLFPLANIERVEIIRGPASAIYGSGAFTGVINIISRRDYNRVSLGVGENQRGKADINLAHSSGEWESNVYAHLAQDQGQLYRTGGQDTRDPREEAVVDWNLKYRNTRVQVFASNLQGDDFYSLEKINNDFNHYGQESRHLRLQQDLNPAGNWAIKTSLAYQKVEQHLDAMLAPGAVMAAISEPVSGEPMLSKGLLESDSLRFHLANDLQVSEQWSWQFGGDWLRERQTQALSRSNYDLGQRARHEFPIHYYGNFDHATQVGLDAERDIGGLYGQFLYRITEDTRLVGGLRYDYYETIGGHASPRLGVVHQLNAHHTLKLLYGEAFRAPGFGETHLINNPVIVSNPDLDSEAVKSLELLWAGTWSHLSMGATVYRNNYENPISLGFAGAARTFINGENEDNWGAGGRVDWQLNPQWMLRATYSSLMDLPDSAFREADQLGSLGVNYQRAQWNWNLSAVYRGEREYLLGRQRATLASYWYANTQVRYRINAAATIALAVKNMADEDYATSPQGLALPGGVPARGREASIVWQWEW
ncbi:MAG TPA: TonB-dependent receptor [Cellvibrio sp.]|nr:TonB-dependent receptor [Cellvibrio sp.]